MSKFSKILLILLASLVLIGFLIYYFFFGVTKKQKYLKCIHTCEKTLILQSDKHYCPSRCQKVTHYQDPTANSPNKADTQIKNNNVIYYCEWSWPQKIINKETKKVVKSCSNQEPYCNKADGSYEKVSCCKNYDKITQTYNECTFLKDMEK